MGRDASGIQHDVSYEEDDEWDDDDDDDEDDDDEDDNEEEDALRQAGTETCCVLLPYKVVLSYDGDRNCL